MNLLHSHLYQGWVRHRRYTPKPHAFRYPVFMSWLDLNELEQVMLISKFWSLERFNVVSYFRQDYLGDSNQALSAAVTARIQAQTGNDFSGRICLLTHLRYLGFGFNPVSFYFCYPDNSTAPRYILAEITNTPWGERYCYVLDTRTSPLAAGNDKWTFVFDKAFHVSPFMPMNLAYCWKFSLRNNHLTIHMQLLENGQTCFDATLQLKAVAMTQQSMRTIPLRYPFMTLAVVVSIYWQALRLWLKGIPFFNHPNT